MYRSNVKELCSLCPVQSQYKMLVYKVISNAPLYAVSHTERGASI